MSEMLKNGVYNEAVEEAQKQNTSGSSDGGSGSSPTPEQVAIHQWNEDKARQHYRQR